MEDDSQELVLKLTLFSRSSLEDCGYIPKQNKVRTKEKNQRLPPPPNLGPELTSYVPPWLVA